MSSMDVALVFIIAWFAFNGLMQGLVRQITNLAGFFLGLGLAAYFHRPLAQILVLYAGQDMSLEPLAFVLILLGVYILANLLGFVAQSRKRDGDNWTVDLGGAFLGLIAGILLMAVLAAGTLALGLSVGKRIGASVVGGWRLGVAADVGDVLSGWGRVPWL